MGRLGQQVVGLRARAGRQELQEQRNEVRQLGRVDFKPAVLIDRLEIDHGLAAVAAFAMHMLEQVQRQRTGAVEQHNITLLQIV